ncbi:PLDc N-terminal domain-containing protein [Chitinophagaceae bacterium LWZ2-11]
MLAVLLCIVWLLAIILTIKKIITRYDFYDDKKVLWMAIVIFLPFVGMFVYYYKIEKRLR